MQTTIHTKAIRQLERTISDYKQLTNPQHVKACLQLKAIRQLLEDASWNEADSVKLIIEVDGKQESVDLFFADSLGTLDDALEEMYQQHFDEASISDQLTL